MKLSSVLLFALGGLVACGGESTPPKPAATLTILNPSIFGSDTIQGKAAELLRVEVRDSTGALAPNVEVTGRDPLAASDTSKTNGAYACDSRYASCVERIGTSTSVSPQVTTHTGADGIALIRLEHGTRARSGAIEIAAPSLHLTTTLPYATLPGALTAVVASTPDTAVYAGRTYPLSARATDRMGNTRADAVTIETATPSVATFSNGLVTAVAIGRGTFTARAANVEGQAFVSVPPVGRLVASMVSPTQGLLFLDTDGGARKLLNISGTVLLGLKRWGFDGGHVAVLQRDGDKGHIFSYDTATAVGHAVVDTAGYESIYASWPRSGAPIWFLSRHNGSYGVYRANGDGSGAQLIDSTWMFANVSPDGASLLYGTQSALVNRNITSGAETRLPATFYEPIWSPSNDLIAYLVSGANSTLDLRLIRPDGTGDRLLSAGIYDAISFSSDGQWMLTTRVPVGIELVRVSDGLRIPIPGTKNLLDAAIRP